MTNINVRVEALTIVSMKIVFWDVTPCSFEYSTGNSHNLSTKLQWQLSKKATIMRDRKLQRLIEISVIKFSIHFTYIELCIFSGITVTTQWECSYNPHKPGINHHFSQNLLFFHNKNQMFNVVTFILKNPLRFKNYTKLDTVSTKFIVCVFSKLLFTGNMFRPLLVSFVSSIIMKGKNTLLFRVLNSLGLNLAFILLHVLYPFHYSS